MFGKATVLACVCVDHVNLSVFIFFNFWPRTLYNCYKINTSIYFNPAIKLLTYFLIVQSDEILVKLTNENHHIFCDENQLIFLKCISCRELFVYF